MADYFELFDELGPEFRERVWIESPLQTSILETAETAETAETTETTETTVQVAVWSVVVTGEPDGGRVVSIWRTHRIEMVWERDDWKVAGVRVTEGPTPATAELALPADPAEFVEVDSWIPAVFADTTTGEQMD